MVGTARKTGVLALVAVLLVSLVGAGIAAAAVADITFDEDEYTVDEDDTVTVTVDVTADSEGIDDEELYFGVFEDAEDDTPVYDDSQQITVDADATETFEFTYDAEDADLETGEYDAVVNAPESEISTEPVTFTVAEVASVEFDAEGEIEFDRDANETEFDVSVEAGDSALNDTLSVELVANDTVEFDTEFDAEVDAGANETFTVTVDHDSVDLDAIEDDEDAVVDAELVDAGYAASVDAVVVDSTDSVFAGGAVDSESVTDPIVIGGVIVVIGLLALAARGR